MLTGTGCASRDRAEMPFALAQRPLHGAALGDVAQIGGEQAPAGLLHLGDRDLHRKRLAVGAQRLHLDPPAQDARHAGREIAAQAGFVLRAQRRRNDQLGE